MPTLTCVVQMEIDGHPIPNSPFIQTFTVTQAQTLNVQKAVDSAGSYATIPTVDAIAALTALLLQNPDAQLVYRFNNQSDAGVTVPAGGLVIILGANINSGAATNVKVSNSDSGAVATIQGLAAG
jgi:hypothetical protein